MQQNTSKNASSKAKHRINLEKSFILVIVLLTLLFYSLPVFKASPLILKNPTITIKVHSNPIVRPPPPPPRPPKPIIPVESTDDEMLDALPVDFAQMQVNWINQTDFNPPEQDEEEIVEWHKVQIKPELVKKVAPRYPELARKAGVTGLVIVDVLINTKGYVEKAEIFKSIALLDQAALDAASGFEFAPGKQFDRVVKVKMRIPFNFKLK